MPAGRTARVAPSRLSHHETPAQAVARPDDGGAGARLPPLHAHSWRAGPPWRRRVLPAGADQRGPGGSPLRGDPQRDFAMSDHIVVITAVEPGGIGNRPERVFRLRSALAAVAGDDQLR